MTLDEAIQVVSAHVSNPDEMTKSQRDAVALLKEDLVVVVDMLKAEEHKQKRRAQARKQETAEKRREYRKMMIPPWCEENLKPGMHVKVKAASKERCIERVVENGRYMGFIEARHGHFTRQNKTAGIPSKWQNGHYITTHGFDKITSVLTAYNENGTPIWTPIMDLVEGKVEATIPSEPFNCDEGFGNG